MRVLLFLLQKEFLQIFRNKTILAIIFVAPVMQLLILPNAATFEVKNIMMSIVDRDHSSYSQKLVEKLRSSGYFILTDYSASYKDGLKAIEHKKADLVIEIPAHFERDLIRHSKADILISVDAINGVKASVGGAYATQIISMFNRDIRAEWLPATRYNNAPMINITYSNWYNPLMNYKTFFVPGILVLLLTLVGGLLTALNIVREKEIGTIEQINVTPIKKIQFIAGKLIPFWITGLVILTIGFIISALVYHIIPAGSFLTIYLFAAVYLVAFLGFGLLISTYSNTQQQALFVTFFFLMVFFLMSGMFTPIESMPHWAQVLTYFNPVRYFVEVIRLVVLKGSSLFDVKRQLLVMCMFALGFNTWAIVNYRKTT
ncbi:MAG: ABC transporter permease [Bacteroidetes bacterium 46-16]|nr:MAG: ABC transporter permease [Bacteroidetes bacterium 46-16]